MPIAFWVLLTPFSIWLPWDLDFSYPDLLIFKSTDNQTYKYPNLLVSNSTDNQIYLYPNLLISKSTWRFNFTCPSSGIRCRHFENPSTREPLLSVFLDINSSTIYWSTNLIERHGITSITLIIATTIITTTTICTKHHFAMSFAFSHTEYY